MAWCRQRCPRGQGILGSGPVRPWPCSARAAAGLEELVAMASSSCLTLQWRGSPHSSPLLRLWVPRLPETGRAGDKPAAAPGVGTESCSHQFPGHQPSTEPKACSALRASPKRSAGAKARASWERLGARI